MVSLSPPQETYEWFPLATCIPILQKHRYACFSEASHSIANKVTENNIDDNGNDVEDTISDNNNGDDEMESQEGEHEGSDYAWDEGQSNEEEDEGYRELCCVQFEDPNDSMTTSQSLHPLKTRHPTNLTTSKSQRGPKVGICLQDLSRFVDSTVKIYTFAELELLKETGYLSFEQVRIELRACIEGLGENLVKEISFSL